MSSTPAPRRAKRRLPPLWAQVLAGLVLGLVLGLVVPGIGEHLKGVGDAFVRLIQMSIVPLVFPLVVVSVARVESARSVGRMAAKALVYFEVVTTIILVVALALAFVTGIGDGVDLGAVSPGDTDGIARSVDVGSVLSGIVPDNVFAAFAAGDLLPVLLFAVVLGLALTRVGEKAAPVLAVLEGVADAMFVVIGWVVRLTPIAVVAFVAYSTASYGWDVVVTLLSFVAVFYVAVLVVVLVVFPLVALVFGVPYVRLLRATGDLVLLAFVTRSSEAVLAPLVRRLDGFGLDRSVPSFVLPLGYSFNADGATLYEALAVVFVANAYGVDLTPGRLVTTLLVLIVLTKGIAGVPSAAIVVLFSAAATIGLPAEGVAVLLAVDFVVDMGRTALNVVGNALAATVVAKSEGLLEDPTDAAAREVVG